MNRANTPQQNTKPVKRLDKLKDNAHTIFDNVLLRCSKQLAVQQFKLYMDELRNKLKSTNFNRIINNYDCNTPLENNRLINELWSFEEACQVDLEDVPEALEIVLTRSL